MLKFISKSISEGTDNVLNLGSFVFGITGVIICLVVVVAPYKILEVMSTESINFLGFSILSKKSKSEDRINDLALSWVKGTTINDKKNEKKMNKNEKKNILFKNLFFDIPFDQ